MERLECIKVELVLLAESLEGIIAFVIGGFIVECLENLRASDLFHGHSCLLRGVLSRQGVVSIFTVDLS